MLVYSINIRGGGNKAKRKRIGTNIQKGGVDVSFMQETKLKGLEEEVVKELWGAENVDWLYTDAIGVSGGMLIMWKRYLFVPLYNFRDEGYMGIYVEKNDKLIYYVNVYASCDIDKRKLSLRKLIEFKNKSLLSSW